MYYTKDGFYGIKPIKIYDIDNGFCDRLSFYR